MHEHLSILVFIGGLVGFPAVDGSPRTPLVDCVLKVCSVRVAASGAAVCSPISSCFQVEPASVVPDKLH